MARRKSDRKRWMDVLYKVRKRIKGSFIFDIWKSPFGGTYVGHGEFTDCCLHYAPSAQRSPGLCVIQKHLATLSHFKRWCLENPRELVFDRFPEVKILFAERVLSDDEARAIMKPGVMRMLPKKRKV